MSMDVPTPTVYSPETLAALDRFWAEWDEICKRRDEFQRLHGKPPERDAFGWLAGVAIIVTIFVTLFHLGLWGLFLI